MVEGKDEMRNMIESLESYFDGKDLVFYVEKTEIMRFRKGGSEDGRRGRWKGKKLGEVREREGT